MKKLPVLILSFVILLTSSSCSVSPSVLKKLPPPSKQEEIDNEDDDDGRDEEDGPEATKAVDDDQTEKTEEESDSPTKPTACEIPETTSPEGVQTYGDVALRFSEEAKSVQADGTSFTVYEGTIRRVQVEIKTNPEVADKINEGLDAYHSEAERIRDEAIEEALLMYDENGEESFYSFFSSNASIGTDFVSDSLICFGVIHDMYYGGAHGGSIVATYCFDLNTGELVTIENICKDTDAFQQYIFSIIIDQIKTYPEDNNPYFEGYEEAVPEAFSRATWSVSDSCVITFFTVTYQEYDLAPYAAGRPVFAIPLEDLRPYFNEYGLSLFDWEEIES